MRFITVKNKRGTADKTPPKGYSSWLDFWEKKKDRTADTCRVFYCGGRAEVGGHVYIAGSGGKEYILPLCKSCNNKPDDESFLDIEDDLVAVSG